MEPKDKKLNYSFVRQLFEGRCVMPVVLVAVMALMMGACREQKPLPAGAVMLLSFTPTPIYSRTKQPRFQLTDYASSRFFLHAYMEGFRNSFEATLAETTLEQYPLLFPDLLVMKMLSSQMSERKNKTTRDETNALADYIFIDEATLVMQGLNLLSLVGDTSVSNTGASLFSGEVSPRYLMTIALGFSMVDQKTIQHVILFDRSEKLIVFNQKFTSEVQYILRDAHSPYLIADSYLATPSEERSFLAEARVLARLLGTEAGDRLISYFHR